ncbi:MAG: succinylglutamate desuccinylase/aspartoacylase family protein [Alphaproteobacteria bacterium]|nr:succinylglutamate desuccinylase/aspartoacylase family protein [Alphaproteobacteria bacterium]
MPRITEEIALASPSPGTRRSLKVHRYGTSGARPKAYFHAALHADEWPGLLTLNHLIGLLDAADAEGRIVGEIVLLPYANPIGLSQHHHGYNTGRFSADGGGNFNRHWPNLTDAAMERLEGKIGNDPAANDAAVRAALEAAVGDLPRHSELEILKATLLSLSTGADMVFDVHCDDVSMMHLYAHKSHRDEVMELAGDIQSPVVLLEDDPDDFPFDSANAAPWLRIKRQLGLDEALPGGCFATTVELRGHNDVTDGLARNDAAGLFRYLTRRGVVAGDPGPLAEAPCEATPLEGMDVMRAPGTGIVAWHREIGTRVEAGELMAELVDIEADDPAAARTPIYSRASGLFFARKGDALARPGEQIGKIAGAEPLAHRQPGSLLSP